MAAVRRSELAEQDLRDIWRYIAADNPDAADRLLRKIDAKLEQYAVQPATGTPRDALAPGLRSFPVGRTSSSTDRPKTASKWPESFTAPATSIASSRTRGKYLPSGRKR